MKIETLKKSHLKRNIIIGVVAVAIISAVILNFTRAKYRVTQSIPIVNGTINYTLPDLNVVAITVDGESVDTLPDGNYELLDSSYCTYKDGSTIDNLTLNYDSTTKAFSITPYTTKGTKCYLEFATATTKKVDTILGTIEVNLDTPDFSKTAQASCSNTNTCEETNGIYEETTSKGTTYYFRGTVDNNWVKFADFYWRIIRINEDGSLRLIYSGEADSEKPDSSNITGTETQIQDSAFNSTYTEDNMYVGYMYQSNQVHGLTSNSTIKGVLDTWYQDNLSGYADKIDGNAGFCGDRTPSSYSGSGIGTSATDYAAYNRLVNNRQPSFECSNSSDLFTTSGSEDGNKALTYPIGLISADEVAYAGGVYDTSNYYYYLYTGEYYWTISPYGFVVGSGYNTVEVFNVNSYGTLDSYRVDRTTWGVRPVINLRSDITISGGDGTASNPYVVAT